MNIWNIRWITLEFDTVIHDSSQKFSFVTCLTKMLLACLHCHFECIAWAALACSSKQQSSGATRMATACECCLLRVYLFYLFILIANQEPIFEQIFIFFFFAFCPFKISCRSAPVMLKGTSATLFRSKTATLLTFFLLLFYLNQF